MGLIQLDPRASNQLSYFEFAQFLSLLGYLNNNRFDQNKDNEKIIQSIWLAMHLSDSLSRRNLKFLLCAVHNLWQPDWMKSPIEVKREGDGSNGLQIRIQENEAEESVYGYGSRQQRK